MFQQRIFFQFYNISDKNVLTETLERLYIALSFLAKAHDPAEAARKPKGRLVVEGALENPFMGAEGARRKPKLSGQRTELRFLFFARL
jgi:hypothetical protein